jgi:hypothetical protein
VRSKLIRRLKLSATLLVIALLFAAVAVGFAVAGSRCAGYA